MKEFDQETAKIKAEKAGKKTAEQQAKELEEKLAKLGEIAKATKKARIEDELKAKTKEKVETEERHAKLMDGFEAIVKADAAEVAAKKAAVEAVMKESRKNTKHMGGEEWTANMPEHIITNGGYTAVQLNDQENTLLDLGDQEDDEMDNEDVADDEINDEEEEEMDADDEEENEKQ